MFIGIDIFIAFFDLLYKTIQSEKANHANYLPFCNKNACDDMQAHNGSFFGGQKPEVFRWKLIDFLFCEHITLALAYGYQLLLVSLDEFESSLSFFM